MICLWTFVPTAVARGLGKVWTKEQKFAPSCWTSAKRFHHYQLRMSARHPNVEILRFPGTSSGTVPSVCRGTSHYSYCTESSSQNSVIRGPKMVEITGFNAAGVLANYDTILLDCDGVLWRTDHVTPIHGIPTVISMLRDQGKEILFVTNNSMHARNDYIEKFQNYGFCASLEDIFCVAYASAVYLQRVIGVQGSVYVIGNEGMSHELSLASISHFGTGADPDPVYSTIHDLYDVHLHDNVQAVLVGYDRHFNLNKLFKACSYLTKPDCAYIATNNIEKSVLIAPSRRQPLTGAIVDAVTSASKRRPTVLGKPHPLLFSCVQAARTCVNPARTLMIGDSIPADVGMAKAAGIDSALVLTGASSLSTIEDFPGLEPDFFLQSLTSLIH